MLRSAPLNKLVRTLVSAEGVKSALSNEKQGAAMPPPDILMPVAVDWA
jgi:hypothetical protein